MKATKKFHVKLKNLNLHGLCKENGGNQNEKAVAIEIKWKGPHRHGRLPVPFHRKSSLQKNRTAQKTLTKQDHIEWDDEFESVCEFSAAFWNTKFYVLSGDATKSKIKWVVLGKVALNLAELLSEMEMKVCRNLPITITLMDAAAGPCQATLSVCVNFAEVRDCPDATGIVRNPNEQDKEGFLRVLKNLASFGKKHTENGCPNDTLVSSDSGKLFSTMRRLSFRHSQRKVEPLIEKPSSPVNDRVTVDRQQDDKGSGTAGFQSEAETVEISGGMESHCNEATGGSWETKEIVSRDGKSKLKTDVFFGSFDQRSEKAGGESACTAIVAVITHWLLTNDGSMPSRPELDNLIMEGSSEWQKLCSDKSHSHSFPNKHFDLETVVEADVRPISVSPEKSFVGFFRPEKFNCLMEAMSFDQIWNEISSKTAANWSPRVYIVSWNDHFFVLKMDEDACYVVDSLGERLFEGCNQAYMLRFNSSSMMFDNAEKGEAGELVCSGKECCRAFFERFLAAIAIEELEEEQRKLTSCDFIPHQRLQIDFHFSSLVASSSTNSSCSLFSDEFNSPFDYT